MKPRRKAAGTARVGSDRLKPPRRRQRSVGRPAPVRASPRRPMRWPQTSLTTPRHIRPRRQRRRPARVSELLTAVPRFLSVNAGRARLVPAPSPLPLRTAPNLQPRQPASRLPQLLLRSLRSSQGPNRRRPQSRKPRTPAPRQPVKAVPAGAGAARVGELVQRMRLRRRFRHRLLRSRHRKAPQLFRGPLRTPPVSPWTGVTSRRHREMRPRKQMRLVSRVTQQRQFGPGTEGAALATAAADRGLDQISRPIGPTAPSLQTTRCRLRTALHRRSRRCRRLPSPRPTAAQAPQSAGAVSGAPAGVHVWSTSRRWVPARCWSPPATAAVRSPCWKGVS